MKYLPTILILFVLNIFPQVKESENDFDYLPLKVGNTWEFTNPSDEFSQEQSVKLFSNDKYEINTKNYMGNLSPIKNIEILISQ